MASSRNLDDGDLFTRPSAYEYENMSHVANEKQFPHVWVAVSYGLVQTIFNIIFFYFYNKQQFIPILVAFGILAIAYLALRILLEGKTLVQKKQL